MPVMKAQATQRVRESAVVMDLSDLEREAGAIVSRARAEAARLIAEGKAAAEREQVRIKETARQTGFDEGLHAGRVQGRQEGHDEALAAAAANLKEMQSRWSQTLEILSRNMPVHVADARADLIKLALLIARKVTREESLRNRQVAPALVEDALRMAGAARRVALQVNPVEEELLEGYLPDLLAKLRTIEEVELMPDETIPPGGCILRFGSGEIDARIETQLQRIADELLVQDEKPAP